MYSEVQLQGPPCATVTHGRSLCLTFSSFRSRDEWKQLSGRNMVEMYHHGGKPYLTPTAPANRGVALRVPANALSCTTLSGAELRLPADCASHAATLLVMSFNQQAFGFGQQWMEQLMRLFPQDGSQTSVRAMQVDTHTQNLTHSQLSAGPLALPAPLCTTARAVFRVRVVSKLGKSRFSCIAFGFLPALALTIRFFSPLFSSVFS